MSGIYQVRINGVLRGDIEVESFSKGFTASSGNAFLRISNVPHEAVLSRDNLALPDLNDLVHISSTGFASVDWQGYIFTENRSGIGPRRTEGVRYEAIHLSRYLNRHLVRINGSYQHQWNPANETDSIAPLFGVGTDNAKRWRLWEIFVDVLEHAVGIPSGGSGIPKHHKPNTVYDTYIPQAELASWDVDQIKRAFGEDYEVGELTIKGTRFWEFLVALSEMAPSCGIYIDESTPGSPKLVVHDFRDSIRAFIRHGQRGKHVDDPVGDFNVLESDLSFTLDGVINKFSFQADDVAFRTADAGGTGAILPPNITDPDIVLGIMEPVPGDADANGRVRHWRPKHQALARGIISHSRNQTSPDIGKVTEPEPTAILDGLPYGEAERLAFGDEAGTRGYHVSDDGLLVFDEDPAPIWWQFEDDSKAPEIPHQSSEVRLQTYFRMPGVVMQGPSTVPSELNAFTNHGYVAEDVIVDDKYKLDPASILDPNATESQKKNARLASKDPSRPGVRVRDVNGSDEEGYPKDSHRPQIQKDTQAFGNDLVLSDPSGLTKRKKIIRVDDPVIDGILDANEEKYRDVRAEGTALLNPINLFTYNLQRKISMAGLAANRWSTLDLQVMEYTVFPMKNEMRLSFSNDVIRVGNYAELRDRLERARQQGGRAAVGGRPVSVKASTVGAVTGALFGPLAGAVGGTVAHASGIGNRSPQKLMSRPLAGTDDVFVDVRLVKVVPFVDGVRETPTTPFGVYQVNTLDLFDYDITGAGFDYNSIAEGGRPKEIGPSFFARDAIGLVHNEDDLVFVVNILPHIEDSPWYIVRSASGGATLARTIGGPLDMNGDPTAYPTTGFATYSLIKLSTDDIATDTADLTNVEYTEAQVMQDITVPKHSNVLVHEVGGVRVFDWIAKWSSFSANPLV